MAKRAEQGRTSQSTRRRWHWHAIAVAVALVVAGGIGYFADIGYFAYRAAANPPGTSAPDQGNRHIQSEGEPHEAYNTDPPTSGPHLPYIAPWGVHTRPVALELQVHNLEDGGVVVQYNCECPDLVEKLKAIVTAYPEQVLLAPYPQMKSRIALTAWTRIDTMQEFDAGRIRRFIEAYRGIDHHPR